MLTKKIWEDATCTLWGIEHIDILWAVIITPFTLAADIMTLPFQIIAHIIYKKITNE